MRKLLVVLLTLGLIGALGPGARASNLATQTVSFTVPDICAIGVSGNPGTLTITVPNAGSTPDVVSDTSTTYALSANSTTQITAAVDTDLPTGVVLKVHLAAPTGGSSAGDVTLSATPQTVVSEIPAIASSGNTITYKLDASALPAPVNDSRTVTFTLSEPVG
jgi:hypothetical protein